MLWLALLRIWASRIRGFAGSEAYVLLKWSLVDLANWRALSRVTSGNQESWRAGHPASRSPGSYPSKGHRHEARGPPHAAGVFRAAATALRCDGARLRSAGRGRGSGTDWLLVRQDRRFTRAGRS